jgi:hypothetical protein
MTVRFAISLALFNCSRHTPKNKNTPNNNQDMFGKPTSTPKVHRRSTQTFLIQKHQPSQTQLRRYEKTAIIKDWNSVVVPQAICYLGTQV